MSVFTTQLQEIFPICHQWLDQEARMLLGDSQKLAIEPELFPELLTTLVTRTNAPPWLPDLARVELEIHLVLTHEDETSTVIETLQVNPTLSLVETGWLGLSKIASEAFAKGHTPEIGKDYVLIWRNSGSVKPTVRSATSEELLALKLVVEGLDLRDVAKSGQFTMAALEQAIDHAVAQGLLFSPPSALRRDQSLFATNINIPDVFLVAKTFTLQWHLTQACDLHCRHCYDRSQRPDPSLAEALAALDQFSDFCQTCHVSGQITFTGGNPLLHPEFLKIYREAAGRGFMTAILGNPTSTSTLAKICAIQRPEFFQVSLEGLPDHNDYIRGPGHFTRVMRFLAELREADIFSMVMLTLTTKSQNQVLPLAEILRERTDLFTFNRLSAVGEGASLATPTRDDYAAFLGDYLAAARSNPTLGMKDNLLNLVRQQRGEKLFGGCAGFGCGAAFNFVALLPDGEVHACRKFPSPIGDLRRQTFREIYDSPSAARYRQGPEGCRGCQIRHVCGGCLAVIASQGLAIDRDRDPCCFID